MLRIFAALASVVVAVSLLYNQSNKFIWENNLRPRFAWERINTLASFGDLLKRTSQSTDVIASPEVATIMYFAERDVLDLLGVANTDLGHSPLNPIGAGNAMHRKRNPKTIYDHQPSFIALYGCENRAAFAYEKLSDTELRDFIAKSSFTPIMNNIGLYRAGSRKKLESLGYKNVSVFLGGEYFNYYVSAAAYENHVAQLKVLGVLPRANLTVDYEVSPAFFEKFPDPS